MELEFYTEDELKNDTYLRGVFNYIKKHPGKNENQVKNALAEAGICSELTTRRKIKRLLYLRLIEDRKVKNGFHRFYPTERTEFNTIEQNLDRIQILADKLRQPLFSEYVKGVHDGLGFTLLVSVLEGEFWRSINEIILFLLSLANNGKLSKYDSTILSRKIIDTTLRIGMLSTDPKKRLRSQLVSIVKNIKHYQNEVVRKKKCGEALEQKEGKTEYDIELMLRYFKEQELETKQLNEMKLIFYDLKAIYESLSINNDEISRVNK